MLGLILAGGAARRMGGGDKPLRLLDGRPLLDHVAGRLGPQVAAIAISANGDAGRFAAWRFPVLGDAVAGQGPLGGMLAGLRWAAGQGEGWLLVAPGDTPWLPPDLAGRLGAAVAGGAALACAASGGRVHPAVALLPAALADSMAAALGEGRRGVLDWMRPHGPAVVEWPAGGGDPFANINTPEELRAARRGG